MKMNCFTKAFGSCLVAILLVMSLIVGTSNAAEPQKKFVWKYFAMINLKLYAYGPPFYAMCDEIYEKTGGRLKINVFLPGETPIAPKDYLRAIKEGAAEIVGAYPGYFSATEPVLVVTNLPMLMPSNPDLVEKVYDDVKGQLFEPIFDKWGGRSLATWWFPFHAIGAPVHIENWNSLKGMKIRVTGLEASDFVKMLGGVPVTIAWAETPTALMTGVIDGVQTAGVGFASAKLFEYPKIKYINLLEIASMPCSAVVNKRALAQLPEDIQKILIDSFKKYEPILREKQWMADSHCIRMGVAEYGTHVVGPSKQFRKEIVERTKKEVWDPWSVRAGKAGKDALDLVLKKVQDKSK